MKAPSGSVFTSGFTPSGHVQVHFKDNAETWIRPADGLRGPRGADGRYQHPIMIQSVYVAPTFAVSA